MLLSYIEEIAAASGNEKIEVMKKYPEFKTVLLYAYDPFRKYHMTAPGLLGQGLDMIVNHFDTLDDLSSRVLSGKTAFEKVSDILTSLANPDAEVFKRIINKDLRAGINVKSINKAFPGLIPLAHSGLTKPPVMLLKTYKKRKLKFPCLAAVKKDGVRGLWSQDNMMSRQGKPFTGLDHITDQLSEFPYDLDGELCVSEEIFDVASGLIRNDKPTPNAVYHVFDMPSFPGNFLKRRLALDKLLIESDSIKLIPVFKINSEESLLNFYDQMILVGEEGIVIYDPYSLYEGKRSSDWMRLVPLKQADCKVVGFYEGKGKLSGSLGGVVVDYKGHEVKVGTGFSEKVQEKQIVKDIVKNNLPSSNLKVGRDLLHEISPICQNNRGFIWVNKDLFFGAIAQCEFKEETKSGSMRQPRFKRWRWDKEELSECTCNIKTLPRPGCPVHGFEGAI